MNGVRNSSFFLPPPPPDWGPGEGPKGQISLNFNYKVNFKTLCVFSHMKGIKHIIWQPESCPRGGTWGYHGGLGGDKNFFPEIQPVLGRENTHINGTCTSTILFKFIKYIL